MGDTDDHGLTRTNTDGHGRGSDKDLRFQSEEFYGGGSIPARRGSIMGFGGDFGGFGRKFVKNG